MMKQQNLKRFITLLLCIIMIISSALVAYAAATPSKYIPYVVDGRVDYKELYIEYFMSLGGNRDLTPPKSSFTVSVNSEVKGHSDSGDILEVKIGDTLTIQNTSTKGSGSGWGKCDFQISDGTNIIYSTTSLDDIKVDSIPTNKSGVYNIYLNVMDNSILNTENWGNWAYNGTHKAAGTNPGGGTGHDFPGWWYYSKLTVKVEKNKPTADFTINYEGSDITDDSTSPVTVDPGDKRLVLEDCSEPYSSTEPIIGRKWYYWDVNNGWKEIAGSANKTTVIINDMDAGLPSSGQNKAFKLVCTSSAGGEDYVEHTAYFNKVLSSGYIIYYRDEATNRDIYPTKERPGLGFGTYTEHALPAPADSVLVTPSPTTIVLDAAIPFTTFTFYYRGDSGSSMEPPSVILKAPDTVMAGMVVKANGNQSWSNNPGGYIADYYFECEGANLISDDGSSVSIWYPNTGTYAIYLQVEDESGGTDWMEHEITVTPPIPIAEIAAGGKQKENRLVTLSALLSSSPPYYPIDWTKTEWAITPIVNTGATAEAIYDIVGYNANNMPLAIPYTAANIKGQQEPNISFKKSGKYKVTLKVYNTYNYSGNTEYILDIQPDLPPIAGYVTPSKILRSHFVDSVANADIVITDCSYSPDGDYLNERKVWIYYDEDNDGDIYEHTPILVDHTIGSENIETKKVVIYTTPYVGKYTVEIEVVEGFDFR